MSTVHVKDKWISLYQGHGWTKSLDGSHVGSTRAVCQWTCGCTVKANSSTHILLNVCLVPHTIPLVTRWAKTFWRKLRPTYEIFLSIYPHSWIGRLPDLGSLDNLVHCLPVTFILGCWSIKGPSTIPVKYISVSFSFLTKLQYLLQLHLWNSYFLRIKSWSYSDSWF